MGTPSSMGAQARVDDALLDAAIDWLLRVRDDDSGQVEHDCLNWRAAHPDHERAWQGVCAVGSRLRNDTAAVTPTVATQVLHRAGKVADRRVVLKSLALGGTLLLGTGATWRHVSDRQGWDAQYRTGVGVRREIILSDGARVWLNTDTALDIADGHDGRLLVLRRGEILVQTAHGAARQPLRVQTPAGLLQPMGTRFNVRLLPERDTVFLAVQEGAVAITPAMRETTPSTQDPTGQDSARGFADMPVLEAGQQCIFDPTGIRRIAPITGDPAAWRDGMLAASRMPLAQFLAELARHRPGVIQCDPAIAQLVVTGAFPLADTDRVLRALETSLPVQVSMLSRYWVRVRPREL